VKSLYEIVTSHVGESYVRAYCWADSENEARLMFVAKNDPKYTIKYVARLFDADSLAFCTHASDEGFCECCAKDQPAGEVAGG
jgi:hypothetical protein